MPYAIYERTKDGDTMRQMVPTEDRAGAIVREMTAQEVRRWDRLRTEQPSLPEDGHSRFYYKFVRC